MLRKLLIPVFVFTLGALSAAVSATGCDDETTPGGTGGSTGSGSGGSSAGSGGSSGGTGGAGGAAP